MTKDSKTCSRYGKNDRQARRTCRQLDAVARPSLCPLCQRPLTPDGTLWEGRYRPYPADSDDYLLRCCRYIELNPFTPAWSPTRRTIGGRAIAPTPWANQIFWSIPIPATWYLPERKQARRMAYRKLVLSDIDQDETAAIRLTLQRQHALGNDQLKLRTRPRKMHLIPASRNQSCCSRACCC